MFNGWPKTRRLSASFPIDVWVNLAGKSIFDRWTDTTKEQIISSRIEATREVRRIIKQQPKNPGL